MKKLDSSYVQMYQLVDSILTSNKNIWINNSVISSYVDLLAENIKIIKDTSMQISLLPMGLTITKKKLRLELEDMAFMLKENLRMHFTINHKDDDAKLLDYPKSKLTRMTDDSFYAEIKHIGKIVMQMQTELLVFGIDAIYINNFVDKTDKWFAIKPEREKNINSKTKFVKLIPDKIKETNLLLKKFLDPLMLIYKDSAPEFYDSYKRCRKRDEVAGRKNHYTVWITGIVNEAGSKLPVSGVSIVAGKKQKQCLSDEKGFFKIKIYKKDADIIRFTKENYIATETAIPKKIVKNEIKIRINMKKISE